MIHTDTLKEENQKKNGYTHFGIIRKQYFFIIIFYAKGVRLISTFVKRIFFFVLLNLIDFILTNP